MPRAPWAASPCSWRRAAGSASSASRAVAAAATAGAAAASRSAQRSLYHVLPNYIRNLGVTGRRRGTWWLGRGGRRLTHHRLRRALAQALLRDLALGRRDGVGPAQRPGQLPVGSGLTCRRPVSEGGRTRWTLADNSPIVSELGVTALGIDIVRRLVLNPWQQHYSTEFGLTHAPVAHPCRLPFSLAGSPSHSLSLTRSPYRRNR